ncbi:MAG TPA: hypothetical protein VD995_32835 [Azospirillum sp.]|nr:hypothetical protein [Azospirillum sp.]
MTEKRHAMPEKITVEMRVENLPESLRALLPERIPGMPYRVTLEPVDDPEAKLAALRRDLDEGIADVESGQVEELDIKALLAELHRKHGNRKV